MTNSLSFSGQYSFGTLNWFLDTGEQRREILMKMQERFHGTPAVVGLPTENEIRAMGEHSKVSEIKGSNPYLVAAYNTVGAEFGTRGIFPWELEKVIVAGKWQKDMCYVDNALALDSSGRNHALALDVYEQLSSEQRILERLPAVIANVYLEKTNIRDGFPHGLRFVVHSGMEMRLAPALFGTSGYFDAQDAGLVRCGVPESVFTNRLKDTDRYLFTVLEKVRSIENLGLLRLYLGRSLNVFSNDGDLAISGDDGRVVPVFGAEGVSRKNLKAEEKRTPLIDIELAPDGRFYHEGEVWLAFEKSIMWMDEEGKKRMRDAFREGMRKND